MGYVPSLAEVPSIPGRTIGETTIIEMEYPELRKLLVLRDEVEVRDFALPLLPKSYLYPGALRYLV